MSSALVGRGPIDLVDDVPPLATTDEALYHTEIFEEFVRAHRPELERAIDELRALSSGVEQTIALDSE